MNKRAGTGLIVLGVLLAVAGAIMRYAVSTTANGFDFDLAGLILLVVGIGVALLGILIFALADRGQDRGETYVAGRPGWGRWRRRRRLGRSGWPG
jgi:uncharacterized membrane protein YidH (DUF202 family)